jgi:hypothetical protein
MALYCPGVRIEIIQALFGYLGGLLAGRFSAQAVEYGQKDGAVLELLDQILVLVIGSYPSLMCDGSRCALYSGSRLSVNESQSF